MEGEGEGRGERDEGKGKEKNRTGEKLRSISLYSKYLIKKILSLFNKQTKNTTKSSLNRLEVSSLRSCNLYI